jgi:hypothetical protein
MSINLLETMIEDNNIDIEADQVRLIKDMISSHHPSGGLFSQARSNSRDFLYEIVANKRNGIDVDKVGSFWLLLFIV